MELYNGRVPKLIIKNSGNVLHEIKTMQYFSEDDDKVIIKCAEFIPCFKRGFVCDIDYYYEVVDCEDISTQSGEVKNLVLVYINKEYDIESYPDIEYIFYK